MPQNLLETVPQLDSYMATIGKEIATLPQAERDAAQTELRQHLDALVAAQIELGTAPAEAVRLATTQFGNAHTLGKTLRQTWDERLMPPALHADVSRFIFFTMFPAQIVTLGAATFSWVGVAVVLGIAALLGWQLGKKHPALGSTTVLVVNVAYLAVIPFAPWLLDALHVLGWSSVSMLRLPLMLLFPSVVAAVFAHLSVVSRAGKWVPYPWHELRLLPKRAYLMVTRRKVENAAFYRQMLRW